MSIFNKIKSSVKDMNIQDVVNIANTIADVSQILFGNSRRRSDADIARSPRGLNLGSNSYQVRHNVPLKEAARIADRQPGVYVLRLNGQVMKCGRAVFGAGVRWRMQQYYNLNYDGRAQQGNYWAVSPTNRDMVTVSWQCCPESKCKELEAKLFQKYGKGPWGLRAPAHTNEDTWDLRI